MKLIVQIPDEFECDFYKDKFEEFFDRITGDIKWLRSKEGYCLTGNYEDETLIMTRRMWKHAEQYSEVQWNQASGSSGRVS